MSLRESVLSRSRTARGRALLRALPRVMPAAESLKIVERVIVAALDVVDVASGFAAALARVRINRPASVAVAP